MKDCMTTNGGTFILNPGDQQTMPLIYCPDFEPLGLSYPRNLGSDLPSTLYLEIGSFGGKLEVLSLTRGTESMVFIQ
jgi:hypothetical protein